MVDQVDDCVWILEEDYDRTALEVWYRGVLK